MKKFMIISLSIAVVLIAGIIILTDRGFNEALRESNVSSFANDVIGTSTNEEEYIIYIYSPTCKACIELAASDEFQNYIADPAVRMYKISVNNYDESLGEYNPNFESSFLDEIDVDKTPTLIYVKKTDEDKYTVKKVLGSEDGAALLANYTK